MARSQILAGSGLLLLAGCAGSPLKTSVPAGLAFDCEPGGVAVLTFNDGGYLPDSDALARARDGALSQAPRSTATLQLAGARHEMRAEWAELGLRYRTNEPGADGRYTILSMRGEEARIGLRGAMPDADEPEGEQVASCRRAGRTSASQDPARHGDDHGGDARADDAQADEAHAGEPPHQR